MQTPSEKSKISFDDVRQRPQVVEQPTPLFWYGGSEKELRRLVRIICYSEPDLFTGRKEVEVHFRAETKRQRGCFRYIERGDWRYNSSLPFPDHYASRRIASLCELAFRLNPCIGTSWDNPHSLEYRKLEATYFNFEVEAPSGHEKAEAHLDLIDWLDDKLHDPDKRARAGIPPLPGG